MFSLYQRLGLSTAPGVSTIAALVCPDMLETTRPFDIKPAAECQICGTPIAGGAYCLQCEPVNAHLGDKAWVRFRWFSGPLAEARKKRIMALEYVNRAIVGTIAAMLAVVAVGQLLAPKQSEFVASNGSIGVKHRMTMHSGGAKRPLDAVTIS
jgi:hypothetical protein